MYWLSQGGDYINYFSITTTLAAFNLLSGGCERLTNRENFVEDNTIAPSENGSKSKLEGKFWRSIFLFLLILFHVVLVNLISPVGRQAHISGRFFFTSKD